MESGEVVAGRYEIIDLIGSGGMGAVYSARHTLSQREVALKLLHPGATERPQAFSRFQREASAAAKVGHPGLVQVLDAGRDEEHKVLFLVMELLEGETLKRWLSARPVPSSLSAAAQFLDLFAALLEPVEALHRAGFVHRDLKPENVFITQQPEGRVKVLDFGLTREIDRDSDTRTGTALGTPHYMAPEQSLSAKDATPAADVWALGVMLYEGLCGQRPFNGETPNAVLVAACTTAHVPVENHCAWLPGALVSLIDACLSKQPENRPRDAGVLLSELRNAMGSLPSAATDRADSALSSTPDDSSSHGSIALLSTLRSSANVDPPGPRLLELDPTLLAEPLEDNAPTSDGRSANLTFGGARPKWMRRALVATGLVGLALTIAWWSIPRGIDTAQTQDANANITIPDLAPEATAPSTLEHGPWEAPATAASSIAARSDTQEPVGSPRARPPGTPKTKSPPDASSDVSPTRPASSTAASSAASSPPARPDDDPGFMNQWKSPAH